MIWLKSAPTRCSRADRAPFPGTVVECFALAHYFRCIMYLLSAGRAALDGVAERGGNSTLSYQQSTSFHQDYVPSDHPPMRYILM